MLQQNQTIIARNFKNLMQVVLLESIFFIPITISLFFPGPQAFCKKAMERVRSEKNILNR